MTSFQSYLAGVVAVLVGVILILGVATLLYWLQVPKPELGWFVLGAASMALITVGALMVLLGL